MGEMMGIYTIVPTLDRIEIETIIEPKVIVAFGDSITAMNHWVKPLRERTRSSDAIAAVCARSLTAGCSSGRLTGSSTW